MSRTLQVWMGMALAAVAVGAQPVRAGWIGEWTNVAVRGDGERMPPESSTMAIAKNRVRLTQPSVVTLVDYDRNRFTVMNTEKQYFWTGTVDEYVAEMTRNRNRGLEQRKGLRLNKGQVEEGDPAAPPRPVDLSKLPPISITRTDVQERIAGYDTVKYEIRADGELFQEIWVAPTLDVSGDLDVGRYLAAQRKLSAAMLGKSARPYNALYRDEQYQTLLAKAFVLKMITHHIAGGFERVATSFQPGEIEADEFEVPESYRRVRLGDLLAPPPTALPQQQQQQRPQDQP